MNSSEDFIQAAIHATAQAHLWTCLPTMQRDKELVGGERPLVNKYQDPLVCIRAAILAAIQSQTTCVIEKSSCHESCGKFWFLIFQVDTRL